MTQATTLTTSETFRVHGTTDEVTDCGRTGLRVTIKLGILDEDGTVEDIIFYGTDCASKATGRRPWRYPPVAAKADRENTNRRQWAQGMVDTYGPVEGDRRATALLFFARNPQLRLTATASVEVARTLIEARALLQEGM